MAFRFLSHLFIAALAAQNALAAPATFATRSHRTLDRRLPQSDAQKAGEQVREAIVGAFNKVEDFGEQQLNNARENFDQVRNVGENLKAVNNVNDFLKGLGVARRSPQSDAQKAGQQVREAIVGALDKFQNFGEAAVNAGKQAIDQAQDFGEQQLNNARENFDQVRNVGEKVVNNVNDFLKGLQDGVARRSPQSDAQKSGQQVREAIVGAFDKFENFGEAAVNVGQEVINQAQDFGEQQLNRAHESINQATDNINDFLKGLGGN
ncbi:hypothetical protein HK102_009436 [Quaeritorhiza haematococci]|nr:hypothetical protein HK102_009436 [Quaeritorhiza haematococci]